MVRRLLLLMICISSSFIRGQEESTTVFGVLPTDIPTHNLVKYNRFYFNPTFSLVRENKKSINVYSKVQWAGFNDNPQTYLINYTANFDEKTGVSIGLHQQNEGIYRYFGGMANFAYNVELDRDMSLTFGMNLGFSQSGIKSNIDAAQNTLNNGQIIVTDDVILNYENSSVFVLTPGVNFNYAEFDVGVSVINLAAYNLTASELLTDNMAFNGHVMYTRPLERRSDKTVRGMVYATMLPDSGAEAELESNSNLRYGGNAILELPELGWAQAGYNSFYGASVGIGGNITENVSIGYTYEMGLGDVGNFGSTHEVALAYNFEKEKPRRRSSKSKSGTQKAYEARDSEIRRLKKEILEQNKLIRELQNEQGTAKSDSQEAMSALEKSIAEARDKEAEAARQLELQREEEVKLLNRQAEEEERLRSQQRLSAEIAEKQAEEERLAAERRLQEEITQQEAAGQKTEEEQIAAEEAIREAEAAKEQAEEEARIAAQEQVEIAAQEQKAEEERLAAQKETERIAAEQKAEEERLAAQRDIERIEAERKAEEERLAAQRDIERVEQQRKADDQAKSQKILTSTKAVIADGSVEALRSQANLIRSSAFMPSEDQETALAEINAAIEAKEAKEAETARLAEEERIQQEAAETARLAEEQRKVEERNTLMTTTRGVIANGSVNELRSQADIVRSSAILPQADQQSLLAELEAAIAAKEAEAARLAEEERIQQEATEAARLAEEQRKAEEARSIQELIATTKTVITNGSVNELRSQADIVRSSAILPQADQQSLLAELEAAIAAKEAEAARLAEEERIQQEAAEAARLAEEQRKAEQARSIQELIATTKSVIANGAVNELRSQADIVRSSAILPQADQQSLLSELEAAIASKEAEAARLAEEEKARQEAEAARLAAEEKARQEAEAAANVPDENEAGLAEIKQELDNSSRISNKIMARRDSLLTTSLNVDKREFNKLLESLVNMDEDAKDSNPTSSKRLTASNRFVKFADATRPEAQIATKFIPGYAEGYYLIGNVFKGGEYANKFTSTLKNLGFNDAQIIVNPENQFQYVAIESYRNKDQAVDKYISSIDNRYYGDMWILHIAKNRVESFKRLLQETRLIKDTVKDDTVLTESLSYIGGHNIENGYYLITNIFKRENYFEKGMEKLKSQGLEPQFFRNPKDNYIYVYLKRFDDLDEAKQSLFSNVNNSYNGDLYILKIQ